MAGNTLKNQQLVERLLDDLGKLMWTMVWDVANHDRWLLDPEEVHAELCLELVKLVIRYGNKPYIELKSLCVTSLRNRVKDLANACYKTYRKAEASIASLDNSDSDCDDDVSLEESLEADEDAFSSRYTPGVDNLFNIAEFCELLSDDAKSLVQEVLNPSERTMYFLGLTAERRRITNPKGFWTLTITPLIMTRSMGWEYSRLKKAWSEIGRALDDQNHFDGGLVAKEGGK